MSARGMSAGGAVALVAVAYGLWRWWNAPKPELAPSTAKPQLVMSPNAPITLTTQVETPNKLARQDGGFLPTIDTKNFVDPSKFTFAMQPSADRTPSVDWELLAKTEAFLNSSPPLVPWGTR